MTAAALGSLPLQAETSVWNEEPQQAPLAYRCGSWVQTGDDSWSALALASLFVPGPVFTSEGDSLAFSPATGVENVGHGVVAFVTGVLEDHVLRQVQPHFPFPGLRCSAWGP